MGRSSVSVLRSLTTNSRIVAFSSKWRLED